ncbi:hypothetical protein JG688_00016607 [Phytophthora aleatoria]|uniref:Uncharacterized protein n=1 Tax=Phytophthora aleatoria TaxID=2496075 RepID=A0A8J5IDW3_9STRA|nr:hypothetical protein JG688_00016607 [Phytophthora aleatoria]
MVRKTSPWRTQVDARDVRQQHRATGKDVVVPLVLWNEPPQVEVSSIHVLQLPISQPSQNSSTFVTEEDRETVNEVDTRTQLCVFAGTVDGLVLYWRFDEDAVVQVNLLVFPGSDGGGHPVVGIVSGTDEWGQSTLISATKDGALARWQLPNGACAEANASLAKELAPLLGLEMLGNRRFAVVVSEESRLMVLDTGAAEQRWDAVVLSLGAEGLVKCFLWTQPRGSTSGTPFGVSEGGGSASVAWGFRWVQRSSWVISWADEAEDITCSQSTSLKDGDNMNPQTALMGSIKNSYFPLSVHVSPDSSSVLLIWKTKFAVLKRKCVEWEYVLELAEHGNRICNLEWHLERGLLYVECEDRMVYIWSMDTGILERTVPCALLYGGGNASGEKVANTTVGCSLVENSTLFIGNAAVQLIEFAVLRSAEQLKKNWTSYYSSLVQNNGSAVISGENDLPSTYATGSMELFKLSLLLSWGVTPAIDLSCQTILGIEPAHALYSCALQDFISGALTIPVPWTTPIVSTADARGAYEDSVTPAVPAFARNWQHSSALSASIALGVVSLCMSCMEYRHSRSGNGSTSPANKEEFQVLWSQLITQHSVVLPESVAQFREPALEELAAFGFDSCEYTQLAARTLLSGVIKRLPPAERSILSAEYSAKLHWEMVRLETETGSSFLGTVGSVGTSGGASSGAQPSGNSSTSGGGSSANTGNDSATMSFSLVVERLGSLVLLMSMIGTYFPGEISPASAREVCDVLVYLLKAPERFVASVSAELLTKGLMLFRPHLVDLSSLIVQLLLIDMREKQRSTQSDDSEQAPTGPGGSLSDFNEGGTGGSNAAMSLLVEVGAYESAFVLGLLQQEMHNHDRPPGFHESILLYMMELINTHYLLMCRHLPAFVDTIMACLDPTKPERRRRCLPLSTRCLHSLVRRFPMVDFQKETQRLALGTMEAVIVIYDLRTATKWRVLDGHASAVSAVRFRSDGQVLVSYAARDGSVRWWNSGNAGLFGGMLKMHQSCLKEHKLAALKESANGGAPSSTGGASAGLKQIIQTCRFHFLTRKDNPDGNSSSNSDQPKHILRLTREDASQVQFLL